MGNGFTLVWALISLMYLFLGVRTAVQLRQVKIFEKTGDNFYIIKDGITADNEPPEGEYIRVIKMFSSILTFDIVAFLIGLLAAIVTFLQVT